MKKLSLICSSIVAALFLTSCSATDPFEVVDEASELMPMSFSAEGTYGDAASASRVKLDGKNVLWSAGDAISVGDVLTSNRKFTIKEGVGDTKAKFDGVVADNPFSDVYYAMYPYQSTAKRYAIGFNGAFLPNVQEPVLQGYDPKAALMLGKTTAAEKDFAFKNMCAILRITPCIKCDSIEISSAGEPLAGGTLLYDHGQELGCHPDTPYYNTITVKRSDKAAFGNNGTNYYYICVRPFEYTGGFTIKQYSNAEPKKIYVTSMNTRINLKRNKMYKYVLTKENEVVDLGLPSGNLWATKNLGAAKETDTGDLYAWGETETKDDYSTSSYKFYDAEKDFYNKYLSKDASDSYAKAAEGQGIKLDGYTHLFPADDAANKNLGACWYIPTRADYQELKENTDLALDTETGIITCTSKINGRSIKFQAVPNINLWTSDLKEDLSICAYMITWPYLNPGYTARYNGLFIRPVLKKQW